MNTKIAIIVALAALLLAVLTFYAYRPYLNGGGAECSFDTECVPSTCCHASECVPISEAPDCENALCTLNCEPGTLDCGGSCECVEGSCAANIVE